MRSTLSNPIEAGVDTFSKLMGTFNQMDESKQRRELMAQTEADRRLENEKKGAEFEQKQKTWADIEDEKNDNRDNNLLIAAKDRISKMPDQDKPLNPTVDIDEKTQDAYLRAHHTHMGNASSAEIADQIEWQRSVAPQVQGKKGIVKFDNDRGDKFEKIYKIPRQNIETDSYGNVFKNSKISGALIDGTSPDMPSAPMVVRQITPGAYKHIGDKTPTFVAPDSKPQNMVEKGNIDLNTRPVVKNQDGSISTVKSLSVEQDGKEVLIPSISPDGKALSTKEAIAEWEKTITKDKPYGDHLGVFNNVADADSYAQQLHSSKIWQADTDYYSKPTQEEPLKHGGGGDPNAPMVIHPAQFWHSKAQVAKEIADINEQLEAKWGGPKYRERKEAALRASSENKAISEAYKTSNGDLAKFMETVLDKYPEMSRTDAKAAFDTYAKTKPKMTSKAGKEMTDEASLIAQYGEDSPEVKEFRKRTESGGKTAKEGDLRHYEDNGKKISEEYKDGKWVKKATSPAWNPKDKSGEEKPETRTEKNKQVARVDDIATDEIVKDAAKDEVRKGKDADKAVEITNARIDKVISGSGGSGKKAAEDLAKELNIPFDKAKKYIKKRIEKQKKSKAE